ncbi:radical SAM protein with 4Fe4S-binding SPASM domain [Dysgonomonas alginatilytica]|uniref:Radical SAM protein with 4Fe4S-binding SPASM domain n=1 Tax=Dysgonomonas alginatilytica TaxID=1605892 RepID=A0A2V3PQH7_9BACT|nr:radical SAM protein [Dysgonomonas alginatilytica]PXV59350.1 radical SAM protein with 4Fe4S-binding SPASM domain [Dysgonomonas alginatilytica]
MKTIRSRALNSFLLRPQDYWVINSEQNQYLFLSESLKFFKISDSSILEYLKICETKNVKDTFLTEDEIRNIGSILQQKDNAEEIESKDELSHSFLILNVTNGCNLACKYCFANIVGKNYDTMSFETAKAAIDNMLGQGTLFEEYTIYFFGGEPMLKLGLVKQVVEYAETKIVVESGKKVKFLLNTNGTLFTPNSIAFLKKYNFRVTVSIDGPLEQHDINRVYRNGKGSFNKVMEGVQMLKDNKIPSNLRATFNPQTLDLFETFQFFEDLHLPYAYSFTINNDYKSNSDDTFFKEEDYEMIEWRMKQVMDSFSEKIKNNKPVYATGIANKLNAIKYKMKRKHACEAGRRSITVDESGKYYACQNMIPYKHTALGHVGYEIVEEQRQKYMSKSLNAIEQCRDCQIRNLCGGGCEVERLNSDTALKQQMCRFFKMEWKNILYTYSRLQEQ